MNWTGRRRKFRALLAGSRCVYAASTFDPISARIAEEIGFEVGVFAGSTGALTVLGAPDLSVLTLSEFAEQAYRVNRAAELPVLVDADNGYGNALNVMRTVQELETAGVAGLCIEDTALPVPYGGTGGLELISVEEGIGKLRAALAARQDPDMAIVARSQALSSLSIEATAQRMKAYAQTGVDAVFLMNVETRAQLEAVSATIDIPVMVGKIGGELRNLDYLARQRVRVCLQGHAPFAAAVQAIHDTMKALHDGTPPPRLAGLASAELMGRVTREAEYEHWMRDFLGVAPAGSAAP